MIQDTPRILARGTTYPTSKPRYKLLAVIGSGAFSEVWIAKDLKSKTRPYVAVKCCQGSTCKEISKEVQVMRAIQYMSSKSSYSGRNHVATLLDDFVVEIATGASSLYHQCIVMELLVALSDDAFRGLIMRPLLPQLVDAFHFLHACGIVHGDPHHGNIGVLVGNLEGISETRMAKALEGDADWADVLWDFEDEIGKGQILCPTNVHKMHIKVCDFGRAYMLQASDPSGKPDRVLHGHNPTPLRSPEADMFELSHGKAGAQWSQGCDIWAIGCLMFEFARGYGLCPLLGCVGGSDADKLTIRCLLSGMPPEDWLNYCDMGTPLLGYLRDTDGQASRIPANVKRSLQDKKWIRKEMEHQSQVYWKRKAEDFKTNNFPVEEFLDMIRRMTTLDDNKRWGIDQIVTHPFWRGFNGDR